jgi:glycosyltransferase involved in cell wall biosynthesis
MRLLWVVPRYGPEVLGGAETLVRHLATRAAPADWSVEVATTCAVDHVTWANALPPGAAEVDGVRVHRFPVGPRDAERFARLHTAVVAGAAGYLEELEWLAQSVTSPALDRFLEERAGGLDLVVLAPYLFGTTVWGAQVAPERSALMPCLHDEPYARLRTVGRMVEAVRGCLFNAPGEERLARAMFRVRDGGVVGMGFDPPDGPPPPPPDGLPDGAYVVYAGRLEEGKGVDRLVDMVVAAREGDPAFPRLVLVGHGGYSPPRAARPHVATLGFVTEGEKRAVFAGALALVSASVMESLSLVQLEAWLEGTPCVVNAGSEVMADHCTASGGGLAYRDAAGFTEAVRSLRDDRGAQAAMAARGREYVLDAYGWPAVRRRFRDVAERLAA